MRIHHHIKLKILALGFALLLWFHVATNQRYDLAIEYRLTYVNVPDSLVIAAPPDVTFDVLLRGSGKALLRLMWGDRRWPIDLARSHVGRQSIHVDKDQVPLYGIQDLAVIELIDYDTLTVILDLLSSKTVPIVSAVEVEPISGLVRSREPILIPDSVQLHGPRGALETISHVPTEYLVFDDVRNPVERMVGLVVPSGYGIEMSESQTQLYQKVEPYLTREFSEVPVRVTGVKSPEGLDILPRQVSVMIAGAQSLLTQLLPDSILVFCTPQLGDRPQVVVVANASVPAPLQVLKVSPDSVTVVLRERERADIGN